MVYYSRYFYSMKTSSVVKYGGIDSVEYEQKFQLGFHLINRLGGAINSSEITDIFSSQKLSYLFVTAIMADITCFTFLTLNDDRNDGAYGT